MGKWDKYKLHKVLIISRLYIILCVLCAYMFQKKTSIPAFVGRQVRYSVFFIRYSIKNTEGVQSFMSFKNEN
jgi:hypothetical protein